MRDRHHLIMLASAAALALAMSQNGFATEGDAAGAVATPAAAETAAPAVTSAVAPQAEIAPAQDLQVETAAARAASPEPAAPTETAAATPTEAITQPTPAEVARQRSEQRRADAMEQRGLRYEELRQRAAQAGVELPETPPWEQVKPPEMPAFPTTPAGIPARGVMGADERAAHIEKMRNMTSEERLAAREARWAEMRERAAERGIEMPETPPWKAAMERRKAMQEQWDAYRKTVEEMTDEQRAAAQAMFGQQPRAEGPASFDPPPFQRAAPRGYGVPAMPMGSFGPCGRMPCQGYPKRNMRPRPPMMYPPQGVPGGNQGPYPW